MSDGILPELPNQKRSIGLYCRWLWAKTAVWWRGGKLHGKPTDPLWIETYEVKPVKRELLKGWTVTEKPSPCPDDFYDWSAASQGRITIIDDEPIDELFETKQRLLTTEAILRGTEAVVDHLKGELAREKQEKAELQYRYDDLMSDFQERD